MATGRARWLLIWGRTGTCAGATTRDAISSAGSWSSLAWLMPRIMRGHCGSFGTLQYLTGDLVLRDGNALGGGRAGPYIR